MSGASEVLTHQVAPARGDAVVALRLKGVRKTWDPSRGPVLNDVSLTVDPGTIVGIGGVNGAGKTTLLRIAAGLILPVAGAVSVHGLHSERDRTAFQRHIGFVTAGNSGLYGRLRVEHHLDLVTRLALMSGERRRAAITRALDTFDLHDLCGRRVDRLSMGQRQRLRLALGLMHDPDVVLLDEPLTSLDDAGAARVTSELARLRDRGGAAVVCAPTGDDRALESDRRFVVRDGDLITA